MALLGAVLRAGIGTYVISVLLIRACAHILPAHDNYGHGLWTSGTPVWYIQRLERLQPPGTRHTNGRQALPVLASVWTSGTPAWYRQQCEREIQFVGAPSPSLSVQILPQVPPTQVRAPRNVSSSKSYGAANYSKGNVINIDALLLKWLGSPAMCAAHWRLSRERNGTHVNSCGRATPANVPATVRDFMRFGAACHADDATRGSQHPLRSGYVRVATLGQFESLNASAFMRVAPATDRWNLGARKLFAIALVRLYWLLPHPNTLLLPLSGALQPLRAKASARLGRGFTVMLWLRRCQAGQYEYLISVGEWIKLFSIGLLASHDPACPGGCVRVRAGGMTLHTVPSSAYSSSGEGRPAALPEPGKWSHLTVVFEAPNLLRNNHNSMDRSTEDVSLNGTQKKRATLRLYINGRLVSAKVDASDMKPQQAMPSSLDEMWAGGENVLGGRHYFRGDMRDIRVMRAALSRSMIAAAMRATRQDEHDNVVEDRVDTRVADDVQDADHHEKTQSRSVPTTALTAEPNVARTMIPEAKLEMLDMTSEPSPPDRALLYYETPLPRPKLGSACAARDCDKASSDTESEWMLNAKQSERAMRPAVGVPLCARSVRLSGQQSFLPQWSAMGVFEYLHPARDKMPGVAAVATEVRPRIYVQRWTRHAKQRGNGSVEAAAGVTEAKWQQWSSAVWHCPVNGVMTRPEATKQHILLQLRVLSENRSEIVSNGTISGKNIFWVALRSAVKEGLLIDENEAQDGDSAALWPLRHFHPRVLAGTLHHLAVLRARSDAHVPELVRPAAWQFWDVGNGACELDSENANLDSCATSMWGRIDKQSSVARWASYTDLRVTCANAGGDEHSAVATGRANATSTSNSASNLSFREQATSLIELRNGSTEQVNRHKWRPTTLEHWIHRLSRFYLEHNPARADTASVAAIVKNQLDDLRSEMAWEQARGADCGRYTWCSGRAAVIGHGGNYTNKGTTAHHQPGSENKRSIGPEHAFSARSMRRMRAVRELLASRYDELLNSTAAEAVRRMYNRAMQVGHARRQSQSDVRPIISTVESNRTNNKRTSCGSASNGGRVSNNGTLRGCLIYYVSPDQSQGDGGGFERDAVRSMQCMFKHYVRLHGHRVLLFHTFGNLTAERVRRRVPFAELHHVDVGYPPGVDEAFLGNGRCMLDGNDYHDTDPLQRKCGCTCPDFGPARSPNAVRCWPTNYLLMNNFFMHLLWRQPALQACDYFMRVDADLFLQRPLREDPMLLLHRGADPGYEDTEGVHTQEPEAGTKRGQQPRKQCSFTAEKENSDMPGCYEGQLQATRAWAELAAARGVPGVYPSQLDNSKEGGVYWGGWHAGRTMLFTSAAHLEYASWIMSVGGVFTRRWSDQTHYPLATALLTPRDEFCKQKVFGAECRTAGAQGVTVCNASNPSEVFLHEHQFHTRVDVMERCLLDEEDLEFDHDNDNATDGIEYLAYY